MRALEREVVDAVWAAVEPLIPPVPEHHPLGCHRPRMADRLCFWGVLIRLVTGCSWVSVEAILEYQVSDTTLRARRDEWIAAGVFDRLRDHAVHAYDRIGLDLSEVALDGSLHKAPCGGEGTGSNPTDRAKLGWKWSVASDAHGIPIGWAIDGANRNDVKLLGPTLDDVARAGLLEEIETLHLDRGYDYPKIRDSSPASVSMISTSNAAPSLASPSRRSSRFGWDCAGSSRAPTRGSRTTGNSAATPTGEPSTNTPCSVSSWPCSSRPNSSTGAIAGVQNHALSARPLSLFDEDHQRFGQHAVVRHRLGRLLGLHRALESVHVSNVHEKSNPSPVLRVDKCPDVRHA
jgi:transposase